MKYQSLKKVLASVLTGLMVLGCLSACGTQEEESKQVSQSSQPSKQSEAAKESESSKSSEQAEDAKKISYPLEGNIKLTIGGVEEKNVTATAENIGKTSFGQA